MSYLVTTRDITIKGVPYEGGRVVDRAAIPAGCLESAMRVGHIVEQDKPPVDSRPASENDGEASKAAEDAKAKAHAKAKAEAEAKEKEEAEAKAKAEAEEGQKPKGRGRAK